MTRLLAGVLGILLAVTLTAHAAEPGLDREPYPDEKKAFELLVKTKSPAARRYLAWIRHDHAIRLIRSYHQTQNLADLDVGIGYAQSATELAPDVAAFWRVLAMGAMSLPKGDLTPLIAESALVRVLEIEPDDRISRRRLIDHYVGLGEYAEAVPHFIKLMKTLEEDHFDFDAVKMAYACMEGERIGLCRAELEQTVEARPALADARIALAILYRTQQLEGRALKTIQGVVSDAKASPEAKAAAKQLAAHWKKVGPIGVGEDRP